MMYAELKLNQKVQVNYGNRIEYGYVCELWNADDYHPAGGRVEIVQRNGLSERIEFKDYEVGNFIGGNTMDKNIHVYCTECDWLTYTDDGIPTCKHEKECDILDAEDSKSLLDRPYYKPVSKR